MPLRPFERQIFLAAHRGDIDGLRKLCEEHDDADVNIADEADYSPLTIAIMQGNVDTVKALVAMGADVQKGASQNGLTPAQMAAEEGNLEILSILVEEGADPNLQRGRSGNLLHVAAMNGYADIVQWLVQVKGISINVPIQETGKTALHVASTWHRDNTVRWLLANGADPTALDQDQKTPLHCAVVRDVAMDSRTFSDLIGVGGTEILSAQNCYGRTALHEACYRGKKVAAKILLEHGTNMFTIDNLGHTPLYEVACYDPELLQVMLTKLEQDGYTPDQIHEELDRTDQQGWTALHHAIICGQIELVKLLLSSGASLKMLRNFPQQSPLHLVGLNFIIDWEARGEKAPQAWYTQYQNAIEWLLQYGKYFSQYPVIKNGWAPAKIPPLPIEDGMQDIFDVRPIVQGGGTGISALLLDKGATVLVTDEYNNLPFFLPSSIGNLNETFLMLRAAAHEGFFRNLQKLDCQSQVIESMNKVAITPKSKRPASQHSTLAYPVTPSPKRQARAIQEGRKYDEHYF